MVDGVKRFLKIQNKVKLNFLESILESQSSVLFISEVTVECSFR